MSNRIRFFRALPGEKVDGVRVLAYCGSGDDAAVSPVLEGGHLARLYDEHCEALAKRIVDEHIRRTRGENQ
jgi:hypothetical protein